MPAPVLTDWRVVDGSCPPNLIATLPGWLAGAVAGAVVGVVASVGAVGHGGRLALLLHRLLMVGRQHRPLPAPPTATSSASLLLLAVVSYDAGWPGRTSWPSCRSPGPLAPPTGSSACARRPQQQAPPRPPPLHLPLLEPTRPLLAPHLRLLVPLLQGSRVSAAAVRRPSSARLLLRPRARTRSECWLAHGYISPAWPV